MAVSVILIAFLLFLIKILKIKLLEPAGLYSWIWLFFIMGSIFFLRNEYKFEYKGIIWILVTCILAIVSSKIIFQKKASKNIKIYFPIIHWNVLLGFIILALCSVGYTMYTSGVDFSVFSDFSSLQNTAHMSAVNRYASDGESGSVLGQILGSFIYTSPLCSGYSYIYAKEKKEKLICCSSAFPAILSMLLTSAKLALVSFVILFFVGYYVSYIYSKKAIPVVRIKTLMLIGIGVIVLYFLFYLSFVLRIGSGEKNISNVIMGKLMIYAFGHIQGFDIWFSGYAFDLDKYGIGKNTFLSISSKLGLANKNQGIYGLIAGGCTNVYTQFRALIEDFGAMLSLVVIVFIFLMVYYMYSKLLKSNKKNVGIQVLLAANIFWLTYFIVSAWTYTTYLFSFFVFAFYLYICFNLKFLWRKKKYLLWKK